jgi:KH domain-containing RNA-binding signal transduction-associated protein 3
VGKLLGPKGNSLKRLQEETLTKMAVLGKGSMRDKAREEEMRLSKDPKYLHLSEDLHVEVTAFAPPAEAHARLSYALTEVRKYLIPDSNDQIRQLQMKELEILSSFSADPSSLPHPSMQSLQPLLLPSPSYLQPAHLPLLPTPPLDPGPGNPGHPTIAAPPTKYEGGEEVHSLPSDSSALKLGAWEELARARRHKAGPY